MALAITNDSRGEMSDLQAAYEHHQKLPFPDLDLLPDDLLEPVELLVERLYEWDALMAGMTASFLAGDRQHLPAEEVRPLEEAELPIKESATLREPLLPYLQSLLHMARLVRQLA